MNGKVYRLYGTGLCSWTLLCCANDCIATPHASFWVLVACVGGGCGDRLGNPAFLVDICVDDFATLDTQRESTTGVLCFACGGTA